MQNSFRSLSIIIPVFNEKSTIAEVIKKISAVELPLEKEIIVVDDGSTDGTTEILRAHDAGNTVFSFKPVNSGKGAAIRTGLEVAKGDIILIQDADLEYNPQDYQALLEPILNGQTSVVYGSRFLQNNYIPFIRRQANRSLTVLTNLIYKTNLTDMETGFKVFTAHAAAKISLKADGFEIEPEITSRLLQAGFEIIEVPVSYNPRTKFEGKKINWRDGFIAIWMLAKCRFEKKVLSEKQSDVNI
jgi:glycosyltransferase involved in cell wall biosynthesis